MNKIKEKDILPPFLFIPKYRLWRHLLLILVGAVITFNQVFIAYQDCSTILGSRIYLICFSSLIMYCVAIYFNYYFLVPRFLLNRRYVIYSVTLSIVVFLLPTLSIFGEYWVRTLLDLPHRITVYTNPLILIDSLATFMATIICFYGIAVVQLFRHWIEGTEHVNKLESEHLKSELNKLKGQITPSFLSKTLRNASALVKTNPSQTSNILMRLGQLLRYQLYDCNRDNVLLQSEIKFLSTFLDLEQLNRKEFQYSANTEGNLNNIFVSPMLFISLIQNSIEESNSLSMLFSLKNESLLFQCKSDSLNKLSDNTLYLIEKRLGLQYPNKHTLLVKTGIIELIIDIAD